MKQLVTKKSRKPKLDSSWTIPVRDAIHQIKNTRTQIKRAILKMVRTKPDMMTVGNLAYNLCLQSKKYVNETMVADTILSMIDCGELALSSDEYLILGPRAPKLRKK